MKVAMSLLLLALVSGISMEVDPKKSFGEPY